MISKRQLVGRDYACAFAAGLVATALSYLWRFPMPSPGLWEDLAIAAGIRPPTGAFPALWQACTGVLFKGLGVAQAMQVLELLGHLSFGLFAAGCYFVLNAFLPEVMHTRMKEVGWSRRVVRFVLLQGVFAAVCADPVWRAGQFFGPVTLHLLLALLGTLSFIRFLRSWRTSAACLAMLTFGILCADTVLGLPIVLAAVVIFACSARTLALEGEAADNPVVNQLARMALTRWMLSSFVAGFVLGTAVNVSFFLTADGFTALGWDGLGLLVNYLCQYAHELLGATTAVGWLSIILLVIAPLVMSFALVGGAADEDRFLPMLHGVFFGFVGLLAFLQLSGFSMFWFWTWGSAGRVAASGLLLGVCTTLNALTFTLALSVLGVEIYFRNYRRLALQRFPDATEAPAGRKTVATFGVLDRIRRNAFLLEPLIFALAVFPFRSMTTERAMLGILREGLAETLVECGDATCLVTDGAFDAILELEATAEGHPVHTLSMMSGNSPREVYIRLRAAQDTEDRRALTMGTADILRDWVKFRPARAKTLAVQLGFELWRRNKIELPSCSGFLGRPAGIASDVMAAGNEVARALGRRMLDLYASEGPQRVTDPQLREAFVYLQWRIARMCQMRVQGMDWAQQRDVCELDTCLAKDLDEVNAVLSHHRRCSDDWMSLQRGSRLTSREGLRFGLERADFRLARMFAQPILQDDPDDPTANFALGMAAFVEEQYGMAEIYLRRALVKKPDAPSVLNNLGIVLMHQKRYDEAEESVLHALRVLPATSPYAPKIEDTLTQIRKRRNASAQAVKKEGT